MEREGRVLPSLGRNRIFRHRARENVCLSGIWFYRGSRGGHRVGRSSHAFRTSPPSSLWYFCPELSASNRQFSPTTKAKAGRPSTLLCQGLGNPTLCSSEGSRGRCFQVSMNKRRSGKKYTDPSSFPPSGSTLLWGCVSSFAGQSLICQPLALLSWSDGPESPLPCRGQICPF